MATEHPDAVRSLVLAEPPIHHWAKDDPTGRPLYDDFMEHIWRPAGVAFRAGDASLGMKILVDGFGGAGRFDRLNGDARASVMQNARFFDVATQSADPFPAIAKDKVAALRMPILILTGERTVPLHRFVDAELQRVLPRAQAKTVPDAGHGAPREQPEAFNRLVIDFLQRQDHRRADASVPAVRPACVMH